MISNWYSDWIAPVNWEPESRVVRWLRTTPESIRKLMIQFPLSCVVSPKYPSPSDPTVGIVSGYYGPTPIDPTGKLTVRQNPFCKIRFFYVPEELMIVGYWKNITPEVMSMIFSNLSVAEIQQKLSGLGRKT